MSIKYCKLCKRAVEAKRQFRIGTLVAVLLTGFFWLLALPFYKKRCPICHSLALSDCPPMESNPKETRYVADFTAPERAQESSGLAWLISRNRALSAAIGIIALILMGALIAGLPQFAHRDVIRESGKAGALHESGNAGALREAIAAAQANLKNAQDALSRKDYQRAILFAAKVPSEAPEHRRAQEIKNSAALSLSKTLKRTNPKTISTSKQQAEATAQSRRDAAFEMSMALSKEGFDDVHVSTDGDRDEILTVRQDLFKFGSERRAWFDTLERKDKGRLCQLGFEAVTLKEGMILGNSDTWSLRCEQPKK